MVSFSITQKKEFLPFLGISLIISFSTFTGCKNPSSSNNQNQVGRESSKNNGLKSVMQFKKSPYDSTEEGRLAQYGEEIITKTFQYFKDASGKK